MSAPVMLLVLGTAAAQDLTQPCPDVDLDVAADDAVRAVNDDELAWARDVATQALASLGCVPRVADPEDLATLYQARAGASFYAVPQQPHEVDLVAAAAVLPGWFNDRLGPELRAAWLDAAAGLTGGAALEAWPVPDDGVLYVDGAARDAQPVQVLPGVHLVQVAVGADVAWAWTGPVLDGQPLVLDTGLPEPTRFRLVRDNPLLWGGLAAGAAVGGAWFPVRSYGGRFQLVDGVSVYDDPDLYTDPVASLDGHWNRYQAMRGGLAVGTAAAAALLTSHLITRLRARSAA